MATIKKSTKKYAMGGTVTTETTKKPVVKIKKKTTVNVAPKKPASVSERIGNITLRDVKNAGEDALNLATVGLYSRGKRALGGEYKYKKLGEKKNGGKVTKAKKGASIKKAANGTTTTKTTVKPVLDVKSGMNAASGLINGMQTISSPQKTAKPRTPVNPLPAEEAKRRSMRPADSSPERFPTSGVGTNTLAKRGKTISKAKFGTKMTKAQTGDKLFPTSGVGQDVPAKNGKSMKKCRYGCK